MTTAGTVRAGLVNGVESYLLANGGRNSLTLTNANFAGGVTGASITVFGGNAGNTVNAAGLTGANRVVAVGGAGADNFTGGAGNDVFRFTAAALSAGDAVAGGGGTDQLALTTAGAAHVGLVKGVEVYYLANGGANSLTLASANFAGGVIGASITVVGGSGGNTLGEAGVAAADRAALRGGAGADTLIAGRNALLTGNGGPDRFELTTPGSAAVPDQQHDRRLRPRGRPDRAQQSGLRPRRGALGGEPLPGQCDRRLHHRGAAFCLQHRERRALLRRRRQRPRQRAPGHRQPDQPRRPRRRRPVLYRLSPVPPRNYS